MSVKRLHYFHGQLLDQRDFQDEQQYHLSMRRLHNRAFHSAGVVEGLEISRHGNREISVSPGFAVDREGKELIVPEAIVYDLRRHESHQQVLVVLTYKEVTERQAHRDDGVDRPDGAKQSSNRMAELAELSLVPNLEGAGTVVQLGTVHLDGNSDISNITHHNREIAAVVIPHSSIHARHLVNGAVTLEKLSQEVIDAFRASEMAILDESITFEKLALDLRDKFGSGGGGWIRMPFRPQSLRPRASRATAPGREGEFNLDVEFAHCDFRGARGTMAIPVPAGARRILEFRIAGVTKATVNVQVIRTGWNAKAREGEKTVIFQEEIRHAVFDQKFPTEHELDELHAVTVMVHATGESEIWLIAARFE